jgi:predicted amidophosphoribosyltransferase
VPAELKEAGLRVGVVTSLPSFYAERHLERFGIPCDVLVAYHDTSEHKPHPAPLTEALSRLGMTPEGACYVGNNRDDVEAACRAQVRSVGVSWGGTTFGDFCQQAPDLFVYTPDDLVQLLPYFDRARYVGEVVADDSEPSLHRGSLLGCGMKPKAFALGRYYNFRRDYRHAEHELSRLLLRLKDSDDVAGILGRALAVFFRVNTDWIPDFVTAVPPKPGQAINRMRAVLEEAACAIPPGVIVDLDGLICTKDMPGYKSLGASGRTEAVRDAYRSTRTWHGRVLLLDDIITSGATGRECEVALRASGAEEFMLLGLGKAQRDVGPRADGMGVEQTPWRDPATAIDLLTIDFGEDDIPF